MDVSNTLKTIGDLQSVLVDGIGAVKAAQSGGLGSIAGILGGVLKLVGDVKDVVGDATAALPELKDLDAAEVGQIGSAAYVCVKSVLGALAA